MIDWSMVDPKVYPYRHAPRRAHRRSDSIYFRQSESQDPLANASQLRRSLRVRASGAIGNTSCASDRCVDRAHRSSTGIFIKQKWVWQGHGPALLLGSEKKVV